MPDSRYSPFQKSFADLSADDLAALRDVPEGWYVEPEQPMRPSTGSLIHWRLERVAKKVLEA